MTCNTLSVICGKAPIIPPLVFASLFVVCSIVMSIAHLPAGTSDLDTLNPLFSSKISLLLVDLDAFNNTDSGTLHSCDYSCKTGGGAASVKMKHARQSCWF